ncbi:MAG: hypothetical protein WC236_00750 [Gallionellaceae bacterium]|jgi:hypothetical protein
MIKQTFIGFSIVAALLLLGGCKGVAVTKPAADLAPERAQPKSTAARASAKLLVGTQQGGARQGVNLNLNNFVSTFAGKAGSTGAKDGHAVQARFDAPKGITTDGINLYVADLNNHTIRKIDIESGAVETIAGMAGKKGSSDGRGSAARFNRPYGITTDGDYLYVSDSNNHSVRRINIESGAVTTLAGRAGEMALQKSIVDDASMAEVAKILSSYMDEMSTEYLTNSEGSGNSRNHEDSVVKKIDESALRQINESVSAQIDDAIARQFKSSVSPGFKSEITNQTNDVARRKIRVAISNQVDFLRELEEDISTQIKEAVANQIKKTIKTNLAGTRHVENWRDPKTNIL